MRLTIVRHTRPEIAAGICYGQSDIPLASSFLQDALPVKDQLSSFTFDKIFSSPLSRCTQLANFCNCVPIVTDNRLLELNFGVWELKPWSDITGKYAEQWMENYLQLPCPNGESMNMLLQRVENFMEDINSQDLHNVLVFTHGGPIRCFHHILRNHIVNNIFELKVDFGEVFVF